VKRLVERVRRRLERSTRPWRNALFAGDRIDGLASSARATWRTAAPDVGTPELVGANLVPGASALRRGSYHPYEVVAAVLDNVLFDARHHVVLTGRRRLLMDSVSTGDHRHLVGLWQPPEAPLPGAWTTFRSFQNTYYHTLIDNLPRLFLLDQTRPHLGVAPGLAVGSPLSAAEAYLLDRLAPGVAVRQLDPGTRHRVERFVHLGFLTRGFAGWLPPEYLTWLRAKVAPPRPPRRNRRIWIARRVIQGRYMRNVTTEDAVVRALMPLGFEALLLEDLTTAQQIELFYDAEMVVAPHGAGLANLVFGSNAKVIELFPSPFVVPHYYFLAKACGHEYTWLNGNGRHRDSNFTADVEAIVRTVQRWDV
jgi:hypothetical protein